MTARVTHAIQVANWLVDLGYTHCFFLAGGNIMHLLDAARSRFSCVPFIHEVSAAIAAEYFNAVSDGRKRAFVLVTAGPGLTNIVTAVAGAFTESRELLILGGQVKSEDLSRGQLRQRGIQEVDGVSILAPICKTVVRVDRPITREEFESYVADSFQGRKGPVFIEFCLDAQGATVLANDDESMIPLHGAINSAPLESSVRQVTQALRHSQRPVLLLGGGLDYEAAMRLQVPLHEAGIPVATTYNGSDRIDSSSPLYFGRPNTWGMRWSNVLLQQSDLVIAIGTRLGLQQTGFNWQEFAPSATLVQVDIDRAELNKGHPRVDIGIQADAATFLAALLSEVHEMDHLSRFKKLWNEWQDFGKIVRERLPLSELDNSNHPGFWNPYQFIQQVNQISDSSDIIVPCSSGGAFTATYQALLPKMGQRIVSNKSLASMGYGLAGALGAALAAPGRRVLHIEGDGGFLQNVQELGTLKALGLPIKSFLWLNDGYASIRMTQRNYFDGAWIGCDAATGLGLPSWKELFDAFGIPSVFVDADTSLLDSYGELLHSPSPAAFLIPIHPDQTFFPKINSKVGENGSMESQPLHLMSPPLEPAIHQQVFRHLGGS